MLFNSHEFIFAFLPIAFFIYFYLNSKRLTTASKAFLVFSSLFFYSYWNIVYLPLILVSILFNYVITNSMIEYNKNKKNYISKKSLLQIGLIFNIGLLVYFKYMDFFIENFNFSFGSNVELLHLALPLAISFFTLQQVAFLVDSYEGLVKEKNFLDYTLFVTFFPQLIAGPIVHHKEMMPQFASIKNKVQNYNNIALGLFIFSIGLFKKVVIADTFAKWANIGFDLSVSLNFIEAWATSLSYTFQLYFDFSGYTDMAIGGALIFNIRLPQNFNSPYKATGMIDFWKRWHMTLTSFITTYIYTPIIKSFDKLTFHKAMFATLLTFLIAGLWHGASWMFVIFGGLNGLGIAINHYWQKYWKKKLSFNIHKYIAWFITFNFVNIAFIFFRAKEWDDVVKVLSGMISINNIVLPSVLANKLDFLLQYGISFSNNYLKAIYGNNYTLLYLFIAFIVVIICKNSIQLKEQFKFNIKYALFMIILLVISFLNLSNVSTFLYFNF